jgi:hypothetical protein
MGTRLGKVRVLTDVDDGCDRVGKAEPVQPSRSRPRPLPARDEADSRLTIVSLFRVPADFDDPRPAHRPNLGLRVVHTALAFRTTHCASMLCIRPTTANRAFRSG